MTASAAAGIIVHVITCGPGTGLSFSRGHEALDIAEI